MAYVIGEACVDVKDKTCVGECPVDCIYEGPRSLYIHPDECIDCGACEATCPVTAIAYEDDIALGPALVEQSRTWVELHGASGGAKRFGPVDTDHPSIAATPTS